MSYEIRVIRTNVVLKVLDEPKEAIDFAKSLKVIYPTDDFSVNHIAPIFFTNFGGIVEEQKIVWTNHDGSAFPQRVQEVLDNDKFVYGITRNGEIAVIYKWENIKGPKTIRWVYADKSDGENDVVSFRIADKPE